MKTIGFWLLVAGIGIQAATYIAQEQADLTNVTVDQTTFGGIVGPINKLLPIPVGYTLIVGGGLLFLV